MEWRLLEGVPADEISCLVDDPCRLEVMVDCMPAL
jgi:hypothetical protein